MLLMVSSVEQLPPWSSLLSLLWASPAHSSTFQLFHFLLFLCGCFLPLLSLVPFFVLASISQFLKAPLSFLASLFLSSVRGAPGFLSEGNQEESPLRKQTPHSWQFLLFRHKTWTLSFIQDIYSHSWWQRPAGYKWLQFKGCLLISTLKRPGRNIPQDF